MFRFHELLALTFLVTFVAGCQNTGTSFNPLAGYGSPRIQPPATGSFGVPANKTSAPDPYYGSGPAVGAAGTSAPVSTGGTQNTSGWQAPFKSGINALSAPFTQIQSAPSTIQTVGYNEEIAAGQSIPAPGIATQATAPPTRPLTLMERIQQHRMHVNDATSLPNSPLLTPAPTNPSTQPTAVGLGVGLGVAPQTFRPVNAIPVAAAGNGSSYLPAGPTLIPFANAGTASNLGSASTIPPPMTYPATNPATITQNSSGWVARANGN